MQSHGIAGKTGRNHADRLGEGGWHCVDHCPWAAAAPVSDDSLRLLSYPAKKLTARFTTYTAAAKP
jgi:hypothetical protein